MESEHEHFSPSPSESDASADQDTVETTPGHSNQHEQEPSTAEHETQAAEHTPGETGGATRHRRRRTTRSHHADAAAPGSESSQEPEHDEADQETQQKAETTEPAWASAEAPAEAPENADAAAPAHELWRTEAEGQSPTTSAEEAWGFQRWREQPSADWNPFFPRASEPPAFTVPAEASDMTSDMETTSWGSPTPEAEAILEGNVEVIETQEATPQAPAAPAESGPISEEHPETIRAPLSGVEVRPPRRYRFDRPGPTGQETPREAPQAAPQPTTPPSEQAGEKPKAAHGTHRGRGAPHAAEKKAGAETPAEHTLGESIEREMTETPEIEADVVAAEELARATQQALEEEVAEALEGFTAAATQTTSPRTRRRRRRSGSSSAAASSSGATEAAEKAQPPAPQIVPQQPQPQAQPPQPYFAPVPQEYPITNGLQQIGQPQSPFGGPEPSSARGFGPVPRGVAMPAERGVRMPRPERTVETGNVSANQLAMIFTQAIQQQTDRLLMELRRNQGTPSMTVNFPPMPSNERIGVFVDVANLLYSARNMRIAIDFGRLLDFLRGNRRLVRAHAYCPTSPDPRAEQMFLDAVKGLGYRITTKNYKTFSSGAKKADLDLDLCMDIVRLVDSGSVDCISLVSGDSDFLPLLEYCSDHGVRVEVAAFDEATASILRQSCDLFINLSMVEEIRA